MPPTDPPSDDDFAKRLREAMALRDAPPAWVRAATGLWPAALSAEGVLRRLLAVLSFDSWAPVNGALAVRHGRSAARHLLFSAEGRDVDLRITPADDAFVIAGQVLGPDESGRIELADSSPARADTRVAALDALGEFRIEGVAPGNYRLILCLGSDEITLPAIDVGSRTA